MQSKSSRVILFVTFALLASLACKAVTDYFVETPVPSVTEEPILVEPTIEVLPSVEATSSALVCPTVTDKILEDATKFYEEDSSDENRDEPKERYLVTYSVSGNRIGNPYLEDVPVDLIPFQKDEATQKEIWNYFSTLIPAPDRSSLVEYSVVTDGVGNVLAAVSQTVYDPALWTLEVDIRDSGDKLNLTYTLIHEYAHLLTLGPDQVTPSEAVFNNPDDNDIFSSEVNACPDYFPGEGCSHYDSYINAFFNRFWTDIYPEWQNINLIKDDDAYYEALDDFYYKYEDQFVTSYAATNPEEDIAEAFTFFVLTSRLKGDTVAQEKILFFYDYPELVQLRDEIITGICYLNP